MAETANETLDRWGEKLGAPEDVANW